MRNTSLTGQGLLLPWLRSLGVVGLGEREGDAFATRLSPGEGTNCGPSFSGLREHDTCEQ